MIADSHDSRARQYGSRPRTGMQDLSIGADEDSVRRHIASRILSNAQSGVSGLGAAWRMPDAWPRLNSVRCMVFDE